eukprot:TRINITY_DN19415_c0_g3_i3.p1 TRINITY_DN19415_c0_g3~~TRINITY_DN19415_c0_g3_i3.p1  ORF type:complete len:189 (-),score=15.52 TRINITY_DN19415_c0_g3_i3:168-734(-)
MQRILQFHRTNLFCHQSKKRKSVHFTTLLASHDDLLSMAIPVFSITGISFSGLRLLVENKNKIGVLEEGDNIRWSVMAVISCIPLLNWLAWVFAAIEDETNKNVYYAFAAVYLTPWIMQGFDVDAWSVFILILGVMHVQVERLVQTEPQQTLQLVENSLGNVDALKKGVQKLGSLWGVLRMDSNIVKL